MSANLDKSLDDLVGNRRQSARRRGNRRVANKPSTVGGVKKSAKPTKAAANAVHPASAAATASSKIIVSGLPADVSEANIKEYFTKSAGPVKKVMLTYNQNGTSRGIASIIFGKADTAAKAAKDLNGLLVDGRPMKKSQPKPATAAKPANANRGRGRPAARGRRGRNPGRGKPKTVEELDAEMVDYFSNENAPADGNAPNGTAQQANGGEDLGMAEISVSFVDALSTSIPVLTLD
ncbi:mRNA export protein mlo3 [Penicillium alfredii]|uniref:mRNA export protein mlo3 n=1 Tax=Penicillium alfredii TaxID=1506179 RepID=A0A9W9FKN4_9EURO|nr:mRNA export protein mlo3 [Penicillium alfredii]KAJ5101966.1 mRNA export protein mlo3 [Penicillium alfredii]